jgi:TrmH family RNA methyltransferase
MITSHSNPKLKEVRELRHARARRERGLGLAEGIRPVGEACSARSRGVTIDALYYAPDRLKSDYALELIRREADLGTPVYDVSVEAFETIAEKDNPQGILAVVRLPELHLESLRPANFGWGVALVDPQDPGNLGTILRTVDAVGASGVLLVDGTLDPGHPTVARASMGAVFWLPVIETTYDAFAGWGRRNHYHIFGAEDDGSVDYRTVSDYPAPRILLMGSEREGLSPEQTGICEKLVRLPMRGRSTSLNLSIATGVMLYAMLAADETVRAAA